MLARRWRCRPSEADDEPAIWVLRQRLFDQYDATFRTLDARDLDDE